MHITIENADAEIRSITPFQLQYIARAVRAQVARDWKRKQPPAKPKMFSDAEGLSELDRVLAFIAPDPIKPTTP